MKHNRIAVSTFFFVNGFIYANWSSRIPAIENHFGISHTTLGTLLFAYALGALLAMPLAGWLTLKFGSRKVTLFGAVMSCLLVPTFVFYPNVWFAGLILFVNGCAVGACDVAMNGQAVFVERLYTRPIMSSFHAIFSIGMALGAGTGALFAKMEVSLFQHFSTVVIPSIIFCIWAYFHLINDEPDKVQTSESGDSFRLPTKAILPLGIIAFCCMMGEGAMADWSALYMKEIVLQNEFYSALAIGTFATAMTLGRVFGDYFTARLGKYKLMTYNSLVAIIGLSIALAFPTTWFTLLGFFLVGLGLSTIVPIVYSTAGNTKGVEPSVGIAMATTVGYAGFFVGPPSIGFLSDYFTLRVGLGFILILFIVMLILVLINQSSSKKQHE